MHKIKLVPDAPFFNNVDITVYDVTSGVEKKRCKIQAQFAQVDVEQLKKQGMDFEKAMDHYREWVYNVVKVYIADDWQCVSGEDQVMKIIEDHVKNYY